jgi:hypothetical protein
MAFDVNVVGGFCVKRDAQSINEAKRIAKETSKNSCNFVQVIDVHQGFAVAEYQNGKKV